MPAPTEPTSASPNPAFPDLDLKNRHLAAFLAWLIPGLGHIYQRRYGKGLLFAICILGTFYYGLAIGENKVVFASTQPIVSRNFAFVRDRWQYPCQFWVGLPALPALVQRARVIDGNEPFPFIGMAPPRETLPNGERFTSTDVGNQTIYQPNELAQWQYDLGYKFELGWVFTVVAGLLNVLAIFDAHAGPLPVHQHPPDDKKKENEGDKNGSG
jgi:hypothetical protein